MARRLNVKTHILRYWEEQFPMLNPLKRAGGRRLYRPADVALLEQIQQLLDKQGYTIRGARSFLAGGGAASGGSGAQDASSDLHTPAGARTDLVALRAIRNQLAAALNAA